MNFPIIPVFEPLEIRAHRSCFPMYNTFVNEYTELFVDEQLRAKYFSVLPFHDCSFFELLMIFDFWCKNRIQHYYDEYYSYLPYRLLRLDNWYRGPEAKVVFPLIAKSFYDTDPVDSDTDSMPDLDPPRIEDCEMSDFQVLLDCDVPGNLRTFLRSMNWILDGQYCRFVMFEDSGRLCRSVLRENLLNVVVKRKLLYFKNCTFSSRSGRCYFSCSFYDYILPFVHLNACVFPLLCTLFQACFFYVVCLIYSCVTRCVDITASLGKNKSKFVGRFHPERRELFVSDGNYDLNRIRIFRYRQRTIFDTFPVHLHGYSLYDNCRFPFPIYCDEKQFKKLVYDHRHSIPHESWRNFECGVVDGVNRFMFERVWGPRVVPLTASLAHLVESSSESYYDFLVWNIDRQVPPIFFWLNKLIVSFGVWILSVCIYAFALIMTSTSVDYCFRMCLCIFSPAWSQIVALCMYGPVAEEWVKQLLFDYMGDYGTAFASFEFCLKYRQLGKFSPFLLLPVLMHITVVMVFPQNIFSRIFFHALYNLVARHIIIRASLAEVFSVEGFDSANFVEFEDFLKNCHDISTIADVMLKLYNRDKLGLVFTVGMNLKWMRNLRSVVDLENPFSILELIPFSLMGDATALSSENDDSEYKLPAFFHKMRSALPAWISHSPTYSKIVSFIILLAGSRWLPNFFVFQRFSEHFDFSHILESMSVIEITWKVVAAVYRGMYRVVVSGSFRDFFDYPKDVKFLIDTNALLFRLDTPELTDTVLKNVAAARNLIDSRVFVINSVEIQKKLEALRVFCLAQEDFLKGQKTRKRPMLILLAGPPGTGKTVVYESAINVLAQLNGDSRFPGDVINLNVWDKYPASTGAKESAHYIVINDPPAVYTEFPKMDLMPMDILLQRIIDTYPLDFRAADVADKGRLFNDIKYIIITSNHYEYVCPGETEKLQRRMEGGVLVSMYVRSPEYDIEEPYSVFSKFPQAKRNDLTRFKLLNISCKGKHISLSKSEVVFGMAGFLKYLRERAEIHNACVAKETEMFFAANAMCDCGMAVTMHRIQKRDGVTQTFISNPVWGEDTFCCNSVLCEDYIMRVNEEQHLVASIQLLCEDFDVLSTLFTPTRFVLFVYVMNILLCLWNLQLMYFLFFSGLLKFYWEQEENFPVWKERAELFYVNSLASFEVMKEFSPQRYFESIAKGYFLELKRWIRKHLKHFLAFCTLGGGLLLMKKMFGNKEKQFAALASPIYAEDVDPRSMVTTNHRQRANFEDIARVEWGKKEGFLNHVDLITLGTAKADLVALIRNQLISCRMVISSEGVADKCMSILVLLLSVDYFVINRHYLYSLSTKLPFGTSFKLFFKGEWFPFSYLQGFGDDLVEWMVFRHSLPQLVKPLYNFFPKEMYHGPISVTRVSPGDIGEALANPSHVSMFGFSYKTLEWKDNVRKGDCMSVLVGKFHEGVGIVGFLTYGDTMDADEIYHKAGASLTSRSIFDRMVLSDREPCITDFQLLGSDMFASLEELDSHADIRNVVSAHLDVCGTQPGSTQHFRSSLQKSLFHDHFYPKLSQPFDRPVKLGGITSEGEYKTAFIHTFEGFGQGNNFPVELGLNAAEEYLNDCFSVDFIEQQSIKASPVTLGEALFGCGDMRFGRIAFDTSLGPLLRDDGLKNKYDLFTAISSLDPAVYKYMFNEDFRREVDLKILRWKEGIITIPVAEFVGKDEIRSLSKILDFKIRLFANMDATFNIAVRMYVMPLVVLFLSYRKRTECYGGMNAGSAQWDEFASWILHTDFSQIDMDFKTFDSSHCPEMFRVLAYFFWLMATRVGYDKESAFIVYVIIRSAGIQLMRYVMSWFLKFGGLSSGFILTLVINSAANSILMRMAWKALGFQFRDFQNKIRAGTVGDDNASGVHNSVVSRYNMLTIAPLYKAWGYTVTTADKSNKVRETVAPEDLQFVKRKFVYSSVLKGYIAPLEKDSIYKALCFQNKKMAVTPEQRLKDVAMGAQREFFLHGEVAFLQFQSDLKAAEKATGLELDYLNFEILKQEYLDNRFTTFC